MSPSSDKDSPSDSRNNSELLKAIGNPAATEEEWLSACEKLGDYQHPKLRKRNMPLLFGLSALASVVMTALVFSSISVSSLRHSNSLSAPVVQPPLPVSADIDFGPYMADLQRRVKRGWFPPKGNETKRIVTRFKVHSNGALTDAKIYKSSGVPTCDAAALAAIKNAAPLKALPSGASENVEIEFTFDYNVWKQHSPSR